MLGHWQNKSKVPKAPLYPIPVVGEPFTHIVIDVVGPLPRSSNGVEYIFTIIDRATRYPEAFPIKNTTSEVIWRCLVNFFAHFGVPKTVQSDRGTNFLSHKVQSHFKELKIKHLASTPYHPESQGVVERFHQTFKSMMRKFCISKARK